MRLYRNIVVFVYATAVLFVPIDVWSKSNAAAPSMGTTQDITYAHKLWQAMEEALIVGKKAKPLVPFFGGAKPHGTILEIASQKFKVGSHTGFLVVKKNYDGEGVNEAAVAANRARYLKNYTVMFQRENGYDNDNQNWFWVKYQADGGLFAKKIGNRLVSMAGRISKGKTREDNGGCIYCHSSAGGGDYIFYPKIKNE